MTKPSALIPNVLQRKIAVARPNTAWVTDITYIRTWQGWDKAVVESFFSSLKKEHIKKRIDKIRDLATADISDYIDLFYNQTRRHSHLGGVSPQDFEAVARQRRSVH